MDPSTAADTEAAASMDPSLAADTEAAASTATSADPGPSTVASPAAAGAADLAGGVAALTLDERFDLLMSIGEECVNPDELKNLLQNKPVPISYDGFEPSGRMHIAQVRLNFPAFPF